MVILCLTLDKAALRNLATAENAAPPGCDTLAGAVMARRTILQTGGIARNYSLLGG